MKAVIMAGGQGSRLWPLSRRMRPKQFLSLLGQEAMLVECYKRLCKLVEPQDIYMSCVHDFVPLVKQLLPDVSDNRLIVEPGRRDSGPAMAFAATMLRRAGFGQEAAAFIPTDHAIKEEDAFLTTLRAGFELAQESDGFVDIGIAPTAPLTTLGYTRIGEEIGRRHGVAAHRFLGHVEKPDEEKAKALLASGEYLWHANYFMAKPDALLRAYGDHAPEIYAVMQAYAPGSAWEQEFLKLKPVSMDYAVAEHLPEGSIQVLRGEFGWSDVGQFAQLKEWRQKDAAETVLSQTRHVNIGSTGCLVVGSPDKMVATIGLENMAVIDTPDALLICPLDRASEVKRLVEILESQGHTDLL